MGLFSDIGDALGSVGSSIGDGISSLGSGIENGIGSIGTALQDPNVQNKLMAASQLMQGNSNALTNYKIRQYLMNMKLPGAQTTTGPTQVTTPTLPNTPVTLNGVQITPNMTLPLTQNLSQ